MHACIVYKNGETKVLRIKRFSDLSTDKSDFYYYEEDHDAWGQGTCVKKSDILCVEIAPYQKADWPEATKSTVAEPSLEWKDDYPFHYTKPTKSEPEIFDPATMFRKPESATQMDSFLDNRPYR